MESLKILFSLIDSEWETLRITFAEPWCVPWTVPPGERDDYEIHLLEQGRGRFTIGDRGYEIAPGDIIVLHSLQGNNFKCDSENFRLVFVTFQFANPANAGLITRFNEVLSEEPLPLKVADSTAARKLLYLMHRELTSNSIGHALRLKLHLGALAAELLDTCDWNSGNEPKDLHHIVGMNTNKMVNEVIIYLHENFQTKVRLEALGKLTNLHPRYVCTLFSQVTGKTITGFLRQVRIDKAKRLLLYTTLSITEIAYEVGFSNSQYFSKIFRNVEGLEPRTFRKTRRTN